MRIIAFVLDPPTVARILRHIDQPHEPPAVLPARSLGIPLQNSELMAQGYIL